MAKLTLLEMTQRILSAMDSDEVNSIADTIESQQVATIVRECYEDLITQRDWPFLCELTALEGLADTANPTKMRIPDDVNKILWVRYNKKAITWLPPEEFKALIDSRVEQTGVVDANGYVTNRDPLYWTSYDDQYVHFDSYDSTTEATLVTSKAIIYSVKVPEWTHEDDFVPTLPEKMFPTLVSDAKGSAFLDLKQQANAKEERKARSGRARFQNEAKRVKAAEHVTNGGVNYGRK